jgi:coenzyme F420 hydrogenase subunit delta
LIEELFSKSLLIFGCGNVLFGDDGFGPEVIDYLNRHYVLPDYAFALDVGAGIRDFLFDFLLTPTKPRRIVIVDAVSRPDRQAGDVFELNVDALPFKKTNDFSLHQFPSVNLLQELQTVAGVEVRVLAVQVRRIPDEVSPGLSREVMEAVPKACSWLYRQVEEFL